MLRYQCQVVSLSILGRLAQADGFIARHIENMVDDYAQIVSTLASGMVYDILPHCVEEVVMGFFVDPIEVVVWPQVRHVCGARDARV